MAERASRGLESALAAVRKRPGVTVRELAEEIAKDESAAELIVEVYEILVGTRPTSALVADGVIDDEMTNSWGAAPLADSVASARRTSERRRDEELARALDGALTREEAGKRLGVTPQAVSDRLRARRLVGLRRGREWRFPSWQFGDDGALPGIEKVIAAWPGTPLALSTWAVTPSVDLDGRSPAEVLGRGGPLEPVLDLIHSLAAAAW